MDADHLLAGLDDAQRRAVTHPHRPLAILAPAGSGKTRVLTRRLAWQATTGLIDPRRTLCLSFTREAAGEVRHRLAGLGLRELPAAGTFHAIAYALLRAWWADRRRRAPRLLVDRASYLGRLFPELGPAERARLEVELAWARARGVEPGDYPSGRPGRGPPTTRWGRPHGRAPGPLRGRLPAGRAGRLRRPAGPLRGCLRARPGLRRRPALALPPLLRRRVPGRQPAPAPAAAGLAG